MRMVADVEEEVGDAIEGTAARAQTACEAAVRLKRTLRRRLVQHHRDETSDDDDDDFTPSRSGGGASV